MTYMVADMEAWRQDYVWRKENGLKKGWYAVLSPGIRICIEATNEDALFLAIHHPTAREFTDDDMTEYRREIWHEKYIPSTARAVAG